MTKRSPITRLMAIAAVLLPLMFGAGCNTNSCTENQSSLPLAGFYGSDGGKITVDSLRISGVGAPADSALYNGASPLTQVYLPLRSTMKTTSYCFRYLQHNLNFTEFNDTITLDYTSEPYFTSEECGLSYTYRVTRMSYTTHIIDSVKLIDSIITPTDLERMQIYFRTAVDDEPDNSGEETTQSIAAHETR